MVKVHVDANALHNLARASERHQLAILSLMEFIDDSLKPLLSEEHARDLLRIIETLNEASEAQKLALKKLL